MPALYTHYKFGQDILNKLNKPIQKKINTNIEYYNMFNQGFDNLYYYPFKWNYYKNFGINAHKYNIDIFFTSIFKYIKDNNLQNNQKITNLIYGFINHYTLDTILHPYINYQVKNLNIPHTKIEFMLDYYLYTKNNLKWKNKIYKTLIPKLKFPKELLNTINYLFKNTYNENNIGKIFNKSHNCCYYIYRYFINDLSGIKTFIYKIIDFFINSKSFKLHKNTFTKNVDLRILNLQKNSWNNPKDKSEVHNYSIIELYNYSLKICLKLNKEAYKVLNNKKDIQDFIKLLNKIELKNIEQFLSQ